MNGREDGEFYCAVEHNLNSLSGLATDPCFRCALGISMLNAIVPQSR